MKTHVIYLNEDENTCVNLIAQGFSTRHILENCTIPAAGFHVFCADIRRKTGVRSQDYVEYRNYLERYSEAIGANRLSPDEARALRRFVDGDTYKAIAYVMQLQEIEIEPLIDNACKAAAIFTRDERARRMQARLYLAIFRPNYGELSPWETRLLRYLAEGKSYFDISELLGAGNPESHLIGKAKMACLRLGFAARGYNAQRNLLRAYFAHLDRQSSLTMDDPMF